jgi:TM2 domain-containing membrane protein YozV
MIPYPVPTPAQPVAAPQPGPYPGYAPRPSKSRGLALVLEIIFGLFGLLGIGWIYAGNLGTGLVFMFVYLGLAFTFIIADVVTSGVCCLVTAPIQLIIVLLSIVMLNGYINKRTDLFG